MLHIYVISYTYMLYVTHICYMYSRLHCDSDKITVYIVLKKHFLKILISKRLFNKIFNK